MSNDISLRCAQLGSDHSRTGFGKIDSQKGFQHHPCINHARGVSHTSQSHVEAMPCMEIKNTTL